ncbi:MAG: MATE family efflux transporter [Synergistaceae bacterium]|nr:MATE family efflux transporter [Synergistaceae bacterium]
MEKRKLLFKYITPSVVSMVSVFLYAIVDGIFVGRGVGTSAIGAINIVFPYIMIYTALVTVFTVGGMTITAIRIGRGDKAGANLSFRHSVILCTAIGIIMCLAGVFETEPLCRLLGASDVFIDMARDYMFWYSVFFLPCGLLIAFCGTVRNDEDPVLVSASVITATVCNIFGDWLLIFPFHMGIKGAAVATGVSQSIALLIVSTHFLGKKGILRFGKCRFDWSLVKKIIVRGLPECVNQFSAPVSTIAINLVLQKYVGSVGINAFALIAYVSAFAVAVFVGVAEGLQPLFGRSYGEGNEEDLAYYLKWGVIISFAGSVAILAVLFAICPSIYALYDVEKITLSLAIRATYLFSWGYLVQSLNTIIVSYLYSTTRTKYAVTINVLRSFIVNLLVIVVLPGIFGAEAIWFAFTVYEGIVLIVSVALLKRADRKGIISGAKE